LALQSAPTRRPLWGTSKSSGKGNPTITRTSTILLEGLKDRTDDTVWREFDSRYRPILLAVGRRLGLSPADSEDAAQETLVAFLAEYQAGGYQRQAGRLRDWLAGIMTHKVQDSRRRSTRQQQMLRDAAENGDLARDQPSVERAMEEECHAALLRQCLERVRMEVAPQTIESFEMFALQQRPAEQVARQLGVTIDVVYQNKRRVLLRIRELWPELEKSW
jgi:RNA polymerase sigma-70 factor (ECF subfamily)